MDTTPTRAQHMTDAVQSIYIACGPREGTLTSSHMHTRPTDGLPLFRISFFISQIWLGGHVHRSLSIGGELNYYKLRSIVHHASAHDWYSDAADTRPT